MQSKPRSSAFEALHLPIRYRVPRGVSRLVSPIEDVTDDAARSRYDTKAHQQTQAYLFSQGNLDSSKYEYWIGRQCEVGNCRYDYLVSLVMQFKDSNLLP